MAQYIDKDALVAKIERFRKTNKVSEDKEYAQYELDVKCGYDMALDDMLSCINSLSEEPESEDICNQCEAHHDKNKCDKLVFSHKCPITTESLDFDLDAASEEYITKVLERTNILVGNEPVGEEIDAAFRAGAKWQKEQDSIPSKDFIDTLIKRYPEVSFAKLSRIAVMVAKWQREHLWKSADGDDLPEIDREVVAFQEAFPTDVDVPRLFKIVMAHRPNPDGWDGKSIATGEIKHYTPKTYDKGGWNIPDIVYWLDVELPKEIEL